MQRLDLRHVSRWAWAALTLAVVWIVLQMLVSPDISLAAAYVALLGATPALFAAAMLWRAPDERLVRISAAAFALPVLVQALIGAAVLLIVDVLSSDFAYLGPRIGGLASAFSLIGWIFPIVAVTAIALYIGFVRSLLGWVALGWGVVLALGQALTFLTSTQLDQTSFPVIVVSIVGQLVWVAWAFLLAVSLGRRLLLFAVASAGYLVAGVLSMVGLTPFSDTLNADSNTVSQVVLALLWIFSVVPWAVLIAAILRELPRTRTEDQPLPPVRASKRSLSAGR